LFSTLDSSGNSSYIDNVILRDRDANTNWTSASYGTLEERRYYCQNWRADVSALLTSGGVMVEWAKYSPYGIPFGLPGSDTDSDGDCDATDISNMNNPPGSYDVRYDIDLDGDNDATDRAIAQTYYQGTTYGWDVLSSNPDTGTGNRKGYAGYEYHEAVSLYHIRNRVLHPELGRWTRRDPLGYVDGMSVYEYVRSSPIVDVDYMGTSSSEGICNRCRNTAAYDRMANDCYRENFIRRQGISIRASECWKLAQDAWIVCMKEVDCDPDHPFADPFTLEKCLAAVLACDAARDTAQNYCKAAIAVEIGYSDGLYTSCMMLANSRSSQFFIGSCPPGWELIEQVSNVLFCHIQHLIVYPVPKKPLPKPYTFPWQIEEQNYEK